jgi:hypothetical protein
LAVLIPEGEHPFLGPGFLLVSPGTAEHRVEAMLGYRVEQGVVV